MKVPLKKEREANSSDLFTLPTVTSTGSVSTLHMTDDQMQEAAARKAEKPVFGFGKGGTSK